MATVDNHNVTIATAGTGHIARTKTPISDQCYTPSQAVVQAPNFIGSSELKTGKTTKTLINGHSVWTKAGLLDNSLSLPIHPGTLGGVVDSGAYRLWASAVSYSKDLVMEGNGVVRTHDDTNQNRKNCAGIVDATFAKAAEDDLDDKLKKRCVIVKVTGKCKHGGSTPAAAPSGVKGAIRDAAAPLANASQAGMAKVGSALPGAANNAIGVGQQLLAIAAPLAAIAPMPQVQAKAPSPPPAPVERKFGPMPGSKNPTEEVYLGVYSGDEIRLEATREDATTGKAGTPPRCVLRYHTHWLAVTTGNMFWILPDKDTVEDHVGDKWVLKIPGGKKEVTNKAAKPKKPETNLVGPGAENAAKENAEREAQRQANAKKAGADLKIPDKKTTGAMVLEIAKDLAMAYKIWKLAVSPPRCVLTARACGGAKVYIIDIYPEDAFEFDLFSDTIKEKLKFIKGLKKGAEWVSKNLAVGSIHVPFSFEFLQNPSVKLKIAYKELTKDVGDNIFKNHVRRSWSFEFSFSPFLSVKVGVQVPLLKVIGLLGNTVAPGFSLVCEFIEYVLRKADVEGYFFVSLALKINPKIAFTVDEYDEIIWISNSEVTLTAEVNIGIEAKAPSFSFTAALTMVNTLKLCEWKRGKDPDTILEFKLKGYCQFGAKGAIVVDFLKWIWKKPIGREFVWEPSFLRFPEGSGASFGEYKLVMPTSGQTATPDPPES